MTESVERILQTDREIEDHEEGPPSTPVNDILLQARAQLSKQKPEIKEINGSKNAEKTASRKALLGMDLQTKVGIFFNITADPRKSLKILIQLSRIADVEEMILRHSKKGDSIGVCLLKDPAIKYRERFDDETIAYLSQFEITII